MEQAAKASLEEEIKAEIDPDIHVNYRIILREYRQNPINGIEESNFYYQLLAKIVTENKDSKDSAEAHLAKWIADEVHYEIERRLQKLSPEAISSLNRKELYVEVKIAVIRAVVSRASELCISWEGKDFPPDPQDDRNLRASLEPYLHKQSENKPSA